MSIDTPGAAAPEAASRQLLEQSEQRYRSLFENNHTVMLIIDAASGAIVDANPKAASYYGWSRQQLMGMNIVDINTLSAEETQAEMALAAAEQRSYFKFRHRNANGEVRDVDVFSGPVVVDGRKLLYSIVHDATEKRALEESLSYLTRRALYLIDLPKLAETLDEATLMQRGLEMVEELTESPISFLHFVSEDEQEIELVAWSRRTLESYCHASFDRHYPISQAGIWADALRQRQPVVFNDYATAPNKRGLPAGHAELRRLISLPVMEQGKVVMLAGIGNKESEYTERDTQTLQLIANELWRLTQRERNMRQLARYHRMIENSHSEFYSVDVESFRFVDANRGACTNTGYTVDELRAMTPFDLTPETDPEALNRLLEPLRRGGESSIMFTATHRRKDGSSYPAEIHLEMFDDPHPLFVAMVRDVSERQAVERALAANLAHEQQLNKKLEEAQNQLLQSEKMASIGQLAAGVAHELNNPIGFVSSNLGSLETYLTDLFAVNDAYAEAEAAAPDCDQLERVRAIKREKDYDFLRSDIVQLLAESKEGLARVAKIVKDLKDFSRAGEATMQWADLHQGLESTLNIIWNELKYKCTLHKEYGELPEVWCVPAQLNQVFMNLLVNAAHAIPETGDIVIRTGRQGDQVFVAISDSGVGIPAENLNRIFEPFFTTKPVGQGTGLGLSLSYSIVKKHQGRIEVESTPGKGTTFTVWLPIKAPAADATATAPREGKG